MPVTKDLIDLTLAARDQIRKMVDGGTDDEGEAAPITESFKSILHSGDLSTTESKLVNRMDEQ